MVSFLQLLVVAIYSTLILLQLHSRHNAPFSSACIGVKPQCRPIKVLSQRSIATGTSCLVRRNSLYHSCNVSLPSSGNNSTYHHTMPWQSINYVHLRHSLLIVVSSSSTPLSPLATHRSLCFLHSFLSGHDRSIARIHQCFSTTTGRTKLRILPPLHLTTLSPSSKPLQ